MNNLDVDSAKSDFVNVRNQLDSLINQKASLAAKNTLIEEEIQELENALAAAQKEKEAVTKQHLLGKVGADKVQDAREKCEALEKTLGYKSEELSTIENLLEELPSSFGMESRLISLRHKYCECLAQNYKKELLEKESSILLDMVACFFIARDPKDLKLGFKDYVSEALFSDLSGKIEEAKKRLIKKHQL